jgi:small subunit ribosomal protein S20
VPNIKSAKKRVLLSRAANEKNKAAKSVLKTSLKKFDAAVVAGDAAQTDSAYKAAVKTIDQSVKKGILHKNTAARKKSSLARKMNSIAS